ncbi:MAG: S41 family peptidase [Bacteroidales bacterium]|nr:S41 family peptidase [Bacteroidales bacterium]
MKTMRKFIICVILGIFVFSIFGVVAATRSDKSAIARNLNIFNSLYKELQINYVDSIDADKSMKTAIDAMLSELDPYTEYISEEEQEDFKTISSGEYAGIGAVIMQRDNNVYISDPQEGAPAQKAGLRPGDLIVAIDGDTVLGWKSDKVSSRLRGQAGTRLKLTIKRPYVADSIITFDIVRGKIQVEPVPYYGVIRGDIGYIMLSTFNEKSANAVKQALVELKKSKVKSIVLDLRNNGGGLLESAIKIVGLFVPKNTEVLRTRGKSVLKEKIYKTTSKPIDTETPIVVLINGATASSSEIVSGALQDLDRAVIIGNRSYGKGLVQGSRQLPYNGVLKVTTERYYIPSGRLIQAIDYSHRNPDGTVARIPDSLTKVFKTRNGREVRDGGGITPDVEVKYPEGNRLTYNIVVNHWAFDYANRFAATVSSIVSPEEFVITDSIYEDFKRFIDPDKFKYDKVCELRLDDLRKVATHEGYMTDSVKMQFDILEKMLRHDLNKDLDTNRDDISSYLAEEIVRRYYYQRGQIIVGLRSDVAIDEAVNVLHDVNRYKSILNPAKETK